jgi:type II secretory pathway pseudopilin PulG
MGGYRTEHRSLPRGRAHGFTLMETGVALIIVAVAMVLVVQLGYWSIRYRTRTAAHFLAAELAANVLNEAQAVPWESLTKEWAESSRISEEAMQQLSQATLTVHVEQVQDQASTKRVTVDIQWTLVDDADSHAVHLVGLFSRRSAPEHRIAP